QGRPKHVDLPVGEEAAAALSPSEVPVPHRRKDQKAQCQILERDAVSSDFAVGRGCERTKHQTEVLKFLGRRLLTPLPLSLEADCRQGGRLEAHEIGHLLPELSRGFDWRYEPGGTFARRAATA